jgi:HEAT repeat protein
LDKADIDLLWKEVDSGMATSQQKVDAIWESGEAKYINRLDDIIELLRDPCGQVRYYALQAVVVKYGIHSFESLCWDMIDFDEDEDVRSAAAACIGFINENSKNKNLILRLSDMLKENRGNFINRSIYFSILQIGGVDFSDSLFPEHRRPFSNSDIDWSLINRLVSENR